jgi:hypothetical protein
MRKSPIVFGMVVVLLAGCSTVMEYNRPAAVYIKRFQLGERRVDVVAKLGEPRMSLADGANSCDVYHLVVHSATRGEKAGIILGEAAADFFTVGVAEVALTPAEAASRSKPHTVMFCYSSGEALAYVRDEGKIVTGAPPTVPASAPTPAAAAAAATSPPPEKPDPPAAVSQGGAPQKRQPCMRVATDPTQNSC